MPANLTLLTWKRAFPFSLLLLAGCQVASIAPEPERSAPPLSDESINSQTLQDNSAEQAISKLDPLAAITYDNVWERLTDGFELQQYYSHPGVESAVDLYAGKQAYFDRISARAQPYLYWIVEEIEKRNLPLEIAVIPIIESGFNPHAYSGEHASGLWQFVRATGRSFGLEQDWWYDGRRDPIASTTAAIDYLEDLYKQFDEDWLLAFAAYNTGEGNVRKAIAKNQRANKAIDFWSLPLHSETKAHIPRILAMAKLIANSALYEIEIPPISNQSYFDIVEVRAQIDLSLAAELAGIELDFLEQLNPGYLQWATHPDGPQTLLLPKQNASQFDSALAQLPVEQFITWDRYLIRSGDSLSSIAAKMGTRVDVLRSVNELRGSRIIAGESLLIPRNASSTSGLRSPLLITNSNNLAVAIPDSYRVRSGDNLWSIARKFNLKSKDIAHLNQISVDALLHPGQVLRLGSTQLLASSSLNSGSVTVDYLVKSGDSIDRIARNFSLQVEDILTWNKLSASAYIYPGQLIKLVPPSQKVR